MGINRDRTIMCWRAARSRCAELNHVTSRDTLTAMTRIMRVARICSNQKRRSISFIVASQTVYAAQHKAKELTRPCGGSVKFAASEAKWQVALGFWPRMGLV